MNAMRIVLFCAASLLGCLGVAILLYPHAKIPDAIVEANRTPQPMETFDQVVDVADFGPMTVLELMAFYLENPPQPEAVGLAAPAPKRHFGGC